MTKQKVRVVIPADANPWPHEVQVAKILALAGHSVEYIPEANLKLQTFTLMAQCMK